MSPRIGSGVGVLGFGRFGRAFCQLLSEAGRKAVAFDPAADIPGSIRVGSLAELTAKASDIVLAVPVHEIRRALESLKPHLAKKHLVVDVSSVKHGPVKDLKGVLDRDHAWVATHPLFGPSSILRGERPLRAVVCPNEYHPYAVARARALYQGLGCRVIEQDADAHDYVMANTHALAFFVAKGLLEAGSGQGVPFAPPSFQALSHVIASVQEDAGHLFVPIESQNPYAAEAREKLLDALTRTHRQLADATATREDMAIPTSSEPTSELLETRGLIDDLDEELVDLLARRTQLSRRAARVKAKKGKAVQDPAREKEVLSRRKAWAAERGLDGSGVSDVFEALMRFSRAEQRSWMKQVKKKKKKK